MSIYIWLLTFIKAIWKLIRQQQINCQIIDWKRSTNNWRAKKTWLKRLTPPISGAKPPSSIGVLSTSSLRSIILVLTPGTALPVLPSLIYLLGIFADSSPQFSDWPNISWTNNEFITCFSRILNLRIFFTKCYVSFF